MNKNANAWFNKANALDEIGKYDEAIKCYDKAIEINSEDVGAWNNEGICILNFQKDRWTVSEGKKIEG